MSKQSSPKVAPQKADQTRLASEKSLRFMANTVPQLVWITDAKGYHEYYNERWLEFTGTTSETVPRDTTNESWKTLYHPSDYGRAWKAWSHSLKTGDPYEIEYRLYHAPSDTYRWVIARAMPYRDEAGVIQRWYGTSTDIDEQKRAVQLQTFLSNVSKGLSGSLDYETMLKKITELCVPATADWCSVDLYDEERGFEQVSVAHADPKKISIAKEYRAHNPIAMDDPVGLPVVIKTGKSEFYPLITNEMLEQYIEDKKKLAFMKSLNLCSIIIAPLRINKKVVGGISFVSSDSGHYYTESDLHMVEELAARVSLAITNSKLYADSINDLKNRKKLERQLLLEKQKLESRVKERTQQLQLTNEGLREEILKRQAAEQELQAYSEELTRSNKELEDFAYVASHDLQEPLRKIQAFGDLLNNEYRDQLGEVGADYLERMRAAALRMSTLIQDLLAFSRVATRQNPKITVKLDKIATEVLADLESHIDEVQGAVVLKPLPRVSADPTHMRQLFQNLLSNALKFHKPGVPPEITVWSKISTDGMVDIYVRDNGIGFDEKYLDRIFSVFQRLHDRNTYAGTGIGLAVCRKIVEQYGGTITAESKKNKGATFHIRLPQVKGGKDNVAT